jgi:hypothetical protein
MRAVARANGANQIAIVIPYHWVIGSAGSLAGYSCGLRRKQKLIEVEHSYCCGIVIQPEPAPGHQKSAQPKPHFEAIDFHLFARAA